MIVRVYIYESSLSIIQVNSSKKNKNMIKKPEQHILYPRKLVIVKKDYMFAFKMQNKYSIKVRILYMK